MRRSRGPGGRSEAENGEVFGSAEFAVAMIAFFGEMTSVSIIVFEACYSIAVSITEHS